MPFTFAHPAYAFPLKWINARRFSTTGLVLGSMSPDFEYFLVLEPHQTIGHSLLGFVVQAIPLCILFAYLFHSVIKESLALHLPCAYELNRRAYGLLHVWSLRSVRDWIIYIASVSIGFITHITIDSFTHETGCMVQRLPILQSVLIRDIPVYKALQYGLSLLGLTAIIIAIGNLLFKMSLPSKMLPSISGKQKRLYWSLAAATAVIMTAGKLLLTPSGNSLGILVVAPITGFFAGILLASVIWRRA
jgi:hypothetical protein